MQAIADKGAVDQAVLQSDLLTVEGIDATLAASLIANNIKSKEDLAELAIEELTNITELNEEQAGKIIMAARAHWFAS